VDDSNLLAVFDDCRSSIIGVGYGVGIRVDSGALCHAPCDCRASPLRVMNMEYGYDARISTKRGEFETRPYKNSPSFHTLNTQQERDTTHFRALLLSLYLRRLQVKLLFHHSLNPLFKR
jgi:hypothetical protein